MSERIIQLVFSILHWVKISPETKPIPSGETPLSQGKTAGFFQNYLGMAKALSGQILTRKLSLPKEVEGNRKGN